MMGRFGLARMVPQSEDRFSDKTMRKQQY